jgi:hypothetical protein
MFRNLLRCMIMISQQPTSIYIYTHFTNDEKTRDLSSLEICLRRTTSASSFADARSSASSSSSGSSSASSPVYRSVLSLPLAPCNTYSLLGKPGNRKKLRTQGQLLTVPALSENKPDGAGLHRRLPSCTEKVFAGGDKSVFFTDALGAHDAPRWLCKTYT